MQGFLFARPGPREELDRLVADASPLRAAVA
jgi:EAL domain-containing protein (putative c-di-GMP-specific phosphodiesterase class I)